MTMRAELNMIALVTGKKAGEKKLIQISAKLRSEVTVIKGERLSNCLIRRRKKYTPKD